jgi:hemolysin activation/secretion protein
VGGRDSVRGFKGTSLSGDSGYYLRNKITADLGTLIFPMLNDDQAKTFSWLSKTKFAPFYDYGYAKRRVGNYSGYLSGAGFKINFDDKKYNLALTYAWALRQSSLNTASYTENKMFYLEAGINFDLL